MAGLGRNPPFLDSNAMRSLTSMSLKIQEEGLYQPQVMEPVSESGSEARNESVYIDFNYDPDLPSHSMESELSMAEDNSALKSEAVAGLTALFSPVKKQSEYDKWIQENLKVRDCYKYVDKPGKSKKAMCACNNPKTDHMSGLEIAPEGTSWTMLGNTKLMENNSYGKINFEHVETTSKGSQYIRMAKDYEKADSIKKMETVFKQFWKLAEPDLLVSVTGGAKSFNVSRDICNDFQQGLLNVAKSTNAWIITGGQNCGVMKLVGDVMGRSVTNNRIITIGIGNWGKTWNRSMLLNKNSKLKDNEMIANYKIEDPEKGFAALDPNHTHHILIDNGATKIDGNEHSFRSELENLVCDMYSSEGVHLPMICIMIEGGLQSLETALGALRKGHTLVVLKGSGRISEIVCYAVENSIEVEKMENGTMQKVRVFHPIGRAEVTKMINKDFKKYNMTEEIIDDILEIAAYRFHVTIYSIHNPEPLDFYILSSLMQSSANEKVTSASKIRQMKLAITWGHAVIAREFIFARKLYKFSSDDLNELLLYSIIKQRNEFVKLLMDYGADVQEFATQGRMKLLFNSLPANCGGQRLLKEIKGKDSTEEIELSDVGLLVETILQGSLKSVFSHYRYNTRATGDETFENPFDVLVLYCVLMTCQPMALLFWEKSRTPMTTALVAHKIYNHLDMMEGKWARIDEEMTEKLEKAAVEFETLACSIMTMSYHHYEKKDWTNILTAKMKDWGYLSLFEIATITFSRDFISHAAFQSHLTDIWMGGMHPSTPTWKLLLCFLPPLPVFIKFNVITADGRSPEDEDAVVIPRSPFNKLKHYYTSPVTKFMMNTVTYLCFLGIYVMRLLDPYHCEAVDKDNHVAYPNDVSAEHVEQDIQGQLSWKDYYLMIFVISTIPIEIAQIINEPTKTLRKKLHVHFTELYNIIDLVAMIVFMIAFAFKNLSSCPDESRYQLTHFTNFHIYRTFAAICFVLYCLRFIQMFEIHDKIGPKIFILKRMTVDLFFFLFLLIVFTIAYCISTEALLYPFHHRTFSRIVFDAFQRAYLNIFGDLNISGFMDKLSEGHCHNYSLVFKNYVVEQKKSEDGWNGTYPMLYEMAKWMPNLTETPMHDLCESHEVADYVRESVVGSTNFYISFFLLCMYLLSANIMLINLLIAIFSNTYVEVEAKSGIIYKTQRASVIDEFEERPTLPNPLSLLYYMTNLPYVALRACWRKCCHKRRRKSIIADRQAESASAFRATLIEAECMVLHIKKVNTKHDAGLILIEKVSAQNKSIERTIDRLQKDLKHLAESRHDSNTTDADIRQSKIFDKDESSEVLRSVVPDNMKSWDTKYEWYDPPEFTAEDVDTVEEEDADGIEFNTVDSDGIDRISWHSPYPVVDGDPLNPTGRTGLKGRGSFALWGPNHFSVAVMTRWCMVDGKVNKVKHKPVIEVLILRLASDPNFWKFPMIETETGDISDNQYAVKYACFNYGDLAVERRGFVNEKVGTAFLNAKHIFRGYFDNARNSDNAWLEVDVVNVHETELATMKLEKSKDVVELIWQSLDKKISLKNNEAWLLKKICNRLKCHNPYKGESLL